jgi:hypothetical protein
VFDSIIISVATLQRQTGGDLIAFALGLANYQAPMGWIGNGVVAIRTLAVVYPSIDKTCTEIISEVSIMRLFRLAT